jgi:hypothetical protein
MFGKCFSEKDAFLNEKKTTLGPLVNPHCDFVTKNAGLHWPSTYSGFRV